VETLLISAGIGFLCGYFACVSSYRKKIKLADKCYQKALIEITEATKRLDEIEGVK